MFDPSIIETLKDGGLLVGLIILVWMLVTDRIITPGRFKDLADRLIAVERVRDEALAGWKAQAAVTQELAGVLTKVEEGSTEGLELLRGLAVKAGVNT